MPHDLPLQAPIFSEMLMMENGKVESLTARTNKFIEWLHTPQYFKYETESSTEKLIKLVKLIVWSLETSVSQDEWVSFQFKFNNVIYQAQEFSIYEVTRKEIYNKAVAMLLATLEEYKTYIRSL